MLSRSRLGSPRMSSILMEETMKRILLFVLFAGSAFGSNPGPVGFPIISIGLGQTLRLTAVAVACPPNFLAPAVILCSASDSAELYMT